MRKHGFDVLPLDPEPFQPYLDGRRLARWHSPERTQAELASFSLRDAAALPEWNAFWRRAAGIVYPWFLRRPPSLGELKDSVAGTDDAAFLQRLLTVSMGDLVREFFEDEAVRGSFLQVQDVGDKLCSQLLSLLLPLHKAGRRILGLARSGNHDPGQECKRQASTCAAYPSRNTADGCADWICRGANHGQAPLGSWR